MATIAPPPKPPPVAEKPKRWQFSLRTMLIGVTGAAVFFGLASALPTNLSMTLIGLLWLGASGWLLTGLIFAKGDQRAFCVGATLVLATSWTMSDQRLFPSALMLLVFYVRDLDLSEGLTIWIAHMALALIAIANGLFCIKARSYFECHPSNGA